MIFLELGILGEIFHSHKPGLKVIPDIRKIKNHNVWPKENGMSKSKPEAVKKKKTQISKIKQNIIKGTS